MNLPNSPAILLTAFMALAGCQPAVVEKTVSSGTIEGTASVIDGDTIEIHGQRIRLSGIDTPEEGSRCGQVNVYQKAAFALSDMIGSRTVSCAILDTDTYDRLVARCSAGETALESELVRQGWARDWPQYSGRAFAADEQAARAARSGIWGLDCPENLWGDRRYD